MKAVSVALSAIGSFGIIHFAIKVSPAIWADQPLHILTLAGLSVAGLLLVWGKLE